MAVTDLEAAVLRAQILGDGEAADRALNEQLTSAGEADALAALLWAAFAIAVRRYFAAQAPTWHRGQVVRYIAHLRALLSERPDLIDAGAAEDDICVALGGRASGEHDPLKAAIARHVVLQALAADLGLADAEVDALLAEARQVADQHLSGSRALRSQPRPIKPSSRPGKA
jgi:hypothetical protein